MNKMGRAYLRVILPGSPGDVKTCLQSLDLTEQAMELCGHGGAH